MFAQDFIRIYLASYSVTLFFSSLKFLCCLPMKCNRIFQVLLITEKPLLGPKYIKNPSKPETLTYLGLCDL